MTDDVPAWDEDLRSLAEALVSFPTTPGNERPAQEWLRDRLEDWGFETVTWRADPQRLAAHPSFPDDPALIDTDDRPSVAGILEFGDPEAGPTLILNGHVDVVPASEGAWSGDPFEARWSEDGSRLTGRGAADMKSALAACVTAARTLETADHALDGRLVVESVVGEEEGGIGAAAAALENPYPFERDAAIVAEPTELRPVVATEGCVMKRLELTGRPAHAATRWRGVSVLDHFETIRQAFLDLEAQRAERVTAPGYERFENPWPVNFGTVHAGEWASTVPAALESEVRIGVAPGETVDRVEAAFEARLAELVGADPWLDAHPPTFERFSIQFEPAAIDPDEPIVETLQRARIAAGLEAIDPVGETYGADNRHYVAAGIPTAVFGPGTIDQAHFPDETIEWDAVRTATRVLVETARQFLAREEA